MWQLSFPYENGEDINRYKNVQVVQDMLQGWHESVHTLLQATPTQSMRVGILYDVDVPRCLPTSPAVTLLGDACHGMAPWKGQGANTAMVDAVDLAQCLLQVRVVTDISNIFS